MSEIKKTQEELYRRRMQRVRLGEGKATENIGNASGDLLVWKVSPFQMRAALDAKECPFSKRTHFSLPLRFGLLSIVNRQLSAPCRNGILVVLGVF